MDAGGGFWSLLTIVGPILLAAVILFAVLKNRKRSQADVNRTEQATRDVYDKGRTPETTDRGEV